jgi:hypothetical protein
MTTTVVARQRLFIFRLPLSPNVTRHFATGVTSPLDLWGKNGAARQQVAALDAKYNKVFLRQQKGGLLLIYRSIIDISHRF